MRSKSKARSKKSRASQKREAIFWRPRFTWPLRAGKRANANFACSEGFFLSGVPRHMAGWPFLRGQPLLRRLLRPVFRRFSAGAPLLCSRSACRFSAAFTQTLLCLFVWPALPARRALCARSSVLFWLSVCLFRVGCTRVFLLSLIFCPFLPNFFLSNFFSFVAHAATGISLLVSSCGFVPGLRILLSAAFSRTFAPIACLPVLRCLHAHFSLIFRLFLFGFLPLKLLFICRSCRDGHPIFFSERKWGKRTARGVAPSNPIPAPCGRSPLFSRCWPA